MTALYTPTPRQRLAHRTYVDELLYGGAAGGGKSEWVRGENIRFLLDVPGARAVIFRRSFPDLRRAMIPPLLERIPRSLARYNKSDHTWTFVNGSVLELAYLQSDMDVANYQGAEYQLCSFDELTQFTEYQYRYLLSRLRMAGPVKDRMEALNYRPRMLATANPGGIGHAWVKARWIDPAPPGRSFRREDGDGNKSSVRCFIPARVADNPHLDPAYLTRLDELDPDTRRALRDGDWDAYAGQRFIGWRNSVHVITPEQAADLMPAVGGVRCVGVDYGMDAPFSAHWMWRGPDDLVIVYREIYQAGLTPAEQAAAIRDSERDGERDGARRVPVVIDPSTWARTAHNTARGTSNQPPPGSIAEQYTKVFGPSQVVKADNDRLAGVALVADRLRVRKDGRPRLLVVNTCRNLIRTLPALPRDTKNPEDVDTKAEDHCLVGETLVDTVDGPRRIDALVGMAGEVHGVDGLRRFFDVRLTRRAARVVRVELVDGRSVTCTPEHRVLTDRGWVEAHHLADHRMMLSGTLRGWTPPSSATQSRSSTDAAITSAASTSNTKGSASTDSSGPQPTDPSQTAGTSTTSTETGQTTASLTSPSSTAAPTSGYTAPNPPTPNEPPGPTTHARTPPQETPNSPQNSDPKRPKKDGDTDAPPRAHNANNADRSSPPGSPPEPSSARGPANNGRFVPVAAVSEAGTADVYDLTVDHPDHAFSVNGGVLVHNCFDSLRYGLMNLLHRRNPTPNYSDSHEYMLTDTAGWRS